MGKIKFTQKQKGNSKNKLNAIYNTGTLWGG
jgi:hypothetical protein